MQYFDKDGNEVTDVYSKEQLDEALKKKEKEVREELKPKEDVPAEPSQPATPGPEKNPLEEKLEQLSGVVSAFVNNQKQAVVSKYTTGLDADKRKAYEERFNAMQGYGDTPEEIERRASEAYLLETGQRFNDSGFNMQNLAVVAGKNQGGQRSQKELSEQDKALGALFGNKPEDYEKYGNSEQN